MDLARATRRAPLTARKKGSGYENGQELEQPRGTRIVEELAKYTEEQAYTAS